MAHKLWEKNFEVNKEIERFTVGRDRELDLYLAKYDVLGSMAHITMLESIGLLEKDELTQLLAELKNIYAIADKGDFVIEEGVEDVHSQVELMLTQKLGDMGKKIHSGRSRNDQVLVDLKLFTRHELKEIVDAVKILFDELIQKSNQYKDVLMPGYTHLQVAMPSSFGLWFGAYAERQTILSRFISEVQTLGNLAHLHSFEEIQAVNLASLLREPGNATLQNLVGLLGRENRFAINIISSHPVASSQEVFILLNLMLATVIIDNQILGNGVYKTR